MISNTTVHAYEATTTQVEFCSSIGDSQRLTIRFHRSGEMNEINLLTTRSQLGQIATDIECYLQDLDVTEQETIAEASR